MSAIFVNTALTHLKKRSRQNHFLLNTDIEDENGGNNYNLDEQEDLNEQISVDEALSLVQQLPEKYRIIINLYCIDGFTHQQIARELNISEGTSKSQLSRARAKLMALLDQKKRIYERA